MVSLPHSSAALLSYAALAIVGLVVLIVRYKVSAFIALTLASIFLGLCAGLSPSAVFKSFQEGVGSVLGSIALVIALGTVLGKILGETRGAEAIAIGLVDFFGPNRLVVAFFFVGLIVGLPVFFAVGLVLVAPILYATCERNKIPLLRLGLPAVAGLSAAHGLIPPHPGPLAAIELLHANIGRTILFSLPIAAIAGAVAGPLLFRNLRGASNPRVPVAVSASGNTERPGFAISLSVILVPMVLMAGASLSDLLLPAETPVRPVFALLGHPVAALLAGVIFVTLTLGRRSGMTRERILTLSEGSLAPVAMILLVVGTGAGFSRVLIETGAGKAVAEIATRWNLPAVPMGFALAGLIRVATGSATVAITTCAGLVKPIADAQPGTNLELLVVAMGAGSLLLSHVNDGGFWLVKEYLNLSVPEALRTWTVLETVLALVAFGCVMILDVFF